MYRDGPTSEQFNTTESHVLLLEEAEQHMPSFARFRFFPCAAGRQIMNIVGVAAMMVTSCNRDVTQLLNLAEFGEMNFDVHPADGTVLVGYEPLVDAILVE